MCLKGGGIPPPPTAPSLCPATGPLTASAGFIWHFSWGRWGLRQLSGFLVVAVIVALFVPTDCAVGGGGGYVGYIRKALEKGYLEHAGSSCCTDDMFEIFVHFGQGQCSLLPLFVNRQRPCPHTNSLHGLLLPPMHHRKSGMTRLNGWILVQPQTLRTCSPILAFVWVNSGDSETIPWHKVQLTKQCNVDLTTDGLGAMPLNTGWAPVKAHRLQDWEKLKEFQKCMGWGRGIDDHIFEQMELQSGRCTRQGNAGGTTYYSESESSSLLPLSTRAGTPLGHTSPCV